MAVALEIGILDLLAEFLAHALIFLGLSYAAGTVAFLLFQPFLDGADDLFVFVQSDLHAFFTSFQLWLHYNTSFGKKKENSVILPKKLTFVKKKTSADCSAEARFLLYTGHGVARFF